MDEAALRKDLDVAADATTDDILRLIEAEGYSHGFEAVEVDETTVYICPVSKGIFSSIQGRPDPDFPGMQQMGHQSFFTAEEAALNGLRIARRKVD